MVQEERILRLADADFREQVIKLKRSGMHTEGAFARLLALPGNPFDSLLQLEQWSDERIGRLLSERPR
jgi:hypothetical protein